MLRKPPSRWLAYERQMKLRRSSSTKLVTPWIHTVPADMFFAVAMVVYALFLGLELQLRLSSAVERAGVSTGLACLEAALGFIFVIEYVLRARADGLLYVCRPSGIFDGVLVCASVASSSFKFSGTHAPIAALSVLRVARLLRLAMIGRMLHFFPELWLVSQGLVRTVFSVTFAAGPLLLLIYGGGLACADNLGWSSKCSHDSSGEPEGDCIHDLFGSVPLSILTNVKLALGEAWPDIADVMFLQSRWWFLYIVLFLVLSNMVILNIIAEVVCGQLQGLVARSRPDAAKQRQEARRRHAQRLGELFDASCGGADGHLREEGYLELLKSREVHSLLQDMNAGLPMQPEEAVALLDQEDNGYLRRKEWVDGVMQLTGTRGDSSSVLLQLDLFDYDRQVISHAETTEHVLKSVMKDSVTQAGWAVLHQVKALEQEFEDLWLELSSEEHEVASEHCLPTLEKSPRVVKAAMGVSATCDSTRSTPCSSPRSPASELSLPPLETTPTVVRAGVGIPAPEQRAPTEGDVQDACAELEASSRLFQNTVVACSWKPRKEKVHADVATQTDDLPVARQDPALANTTQTLEAEPNAPMEAGTPVSNHDEDDSMLCELLFPDEEVLPDQGDRIQAKQPVMEDMNGCVASDSLTEAPSKTVSGQVSESAPVHIPILSEDEENRVQEAQSKACDNSTGVPCKTDGFEEEAVGTPCQGTDQSSMPHLKTHSPSGRNPDTASLPMLDADEAVSESDSDASVPLPGTNVGPRKPLALSSEDAGTDGLEEDENPGVPSPVADSSQEAGPTTPSNSRRGWASDPQAAQRRRELLASIRRRPGPDPPAASTPPRAVPLSPAMSRDGAAMVHEEALDKTALHGGSMQGQLFTQTEKANAVTAEPNPLALSRRLRSMSSAGPSPLLLRQR